MATQGWGMDQGYAVAADWCRKALEAASPGNSGAVDCANELLGQIANNS